MTPAQRLRACAQVIIRDFQTRYAARTDPDGQPWEPNAPATAKRKGFNDPMRETGQTLAARPVILAEGPTSIEVGYSTASEPGRRVWENSVADAARNRPARVVAGASAAALDECVRLLEDDLIRTVRERD